MTKKSSGDKGKTSPKWISTTEALPVPHKRVLTWMRITADDGNRHGIPTFGVYTRDGGFVVDSESSHMDEVTHFMEIKAPSVEGMHWKTIDQFSGETSSYGAVILWCGDQPTIGRKSSDIDDPERDADGWIVEWRWKKMSKPSHFMVVQKPRKA